MSACYLFDRFVCIRHCVTTRLFGYERRHANGSETVVIEMNG